MPAFKVTNFLGITPRTAERLLPDMAAQEAENLNLTSGEIRPVRPSKSVYTIPGGGKNLAAYKASNGVDEKWRAWMSDVDVAKAPLSPDVEQRFYWTGDTCPKYTTFTLFGVTDYALGIPNPTTTPTVAVTGGSSATTVNRSYCYTFYQPSTGEETGPSPVGDPASGKIDGTWTISGFSSTPANDRAIAYNTSGLKQRLYRTVGTTADFQLVAERAVSTSNWTDTLSDSAILGDSLISSGWEPPPVDLIGLICLPNGSMVGFRGNELLFSEPYQPHAWPQAYRYQVESKIIGIASFGTTVVVATETRPYYADGVTPDVVTMQSVDNVWPCLSKRSVCSVGDGVVYATNSGLAYIGQAGPTIFTKNFFTQEEWTPLNPASMVVASAMSRLFILYTPVGGTSRVLMINLMEQAALTTYSLSPSELYADQRDGCLYLVETTVDKWDAGAGELLMFNWLSKQYELPEPFNFGAAKVDFVTTMSQSDRDAAIAKYQTDIAYNQSLIATKKLGAYDQDAYNVLTINSAALINAVLKLDTMTFTLYANGEEVMTTKLTDTAAFHLPSGYKSDVVSFRLVGNMRVRSVKLAETMIGLKAV